jgi:RNA polymerase sigma factor (TIGR02999 family)
LRFFTHDAHQAPALQGTPAFDIMDKEQDITGLLLAWRGGDQTALDQLLPLVYEELRRIAHRQLGRERSNHTLATNALVHEAYLRLVDQRRAQWADRAQFFAVAARVMRRVLLDYARQHLAVKRGGCRERVSLDEEALSVDGRAEILVAVDEALDCLRRLDERATSVVECRFFGGLTEAETAEALGVTERTVRRDWVKAQAWLYQTLRA